MRRGVINQRLYERIVAEFGEVRVDNEQREMLGTPSVFNGFASYAIMDYGETYNVTCPKCNDGDRRRLSISHRFDEDHSKVRCWNENCYADEEAREELASQLLDLFVPPQHTPVRMATEAEMVVGPFWFPGKVMNVTALPEWHEARQYLHKTRNFSAEVLDLFHVGWCYETFNSETRQPEFRPALYEKLVIPILKDGILVGAQTRAAHENTPKKYGKYHTVNPTRKTQLIYNYDMVKDKPFVVIMEGVTAVWRMPRHAVAVFGHHLSFPQLLLLMRTWQNKPIVLVLDPDQAGAEGVMQMKLSLRNYPNPLVEVTLPHGKDPDDLDEIALQDIVAGQALTQGVRLDFS